MADEVVVELDRRVHSLDAVRAAAYRLIGRAACKIDATDDMLICRLAPVGDRNGSPLDNETLRANFLELITDEILRESVSAKTEGVRNLILSLAFGSLATESKDQILDQ